MPSANDPVIADSFLGQYRSGMLAEFFGLAPDEVDAALAIARPVERTGLVEGLQRYARRLEAPDAAVRQIRKLLHPEARAVVCGQQAGLLLGPMYTLSKAISALQLAARLDTPERPVVPVFWLASQDHDQAEINHAHVLDLEERLLRIELPLPPDVPAGRIPFSALIPGKVANQLAKGRFPEEFRREAAEELEAAAGPARSWSDWTAGVLWRLLGPKGLIVFDPLDADLAPLFREVLMAELEDARASVEAVVRAGQRLTARGHAAQLGRGVDATNLFIEEVDQGFPRRRLLRFDGRNFYTSRRTYSRSDLQGLLDERPGSVTPAAGLRPVTQDSVLPTSVMVVGPGELRYFAQLLGVYRHHGVDMPLVWPRATVTVLEPPARRILGAMDLSPEEFLADPDEVERRVLLQRHGHAERFLGALLELERLEAELRREIAGIDPGLDRGVERSGRSIVRTIERLRGKTARALGRRDVITQRQFERLRSQLLPHGIPQERVLSPFSYFLKFGRVQVLESLLDIPPSGDHVIAF